MTGRRSAAHEHEWVRRQNVTARGFAMPPYEACLCGAARSVETEMRPPAEQRTAWRKACESDEVGFSSVVVGKQDLAALLDALDSAEQAISDVFRVLEVGAEDWREAFDGSDSDADYGRWDAYSNAARIVRDVCQAQGIQ